MTVKLFQEQNDLTEAQADMDARVVRNVILIKAGTSKNRRRYSEAVLANAASVFEAAPAYADHPQKGSQSRSVRDLTGQYTNVRYENGALRADRVFARTQAGNDAFGIAQDVIEGRLSPVVAGLSINAIGTGKSVKEADGDIFEVEAITQALSVDDVAAPAASGSYRESVDSDLLTTAIQAMDYQQWFESSGEHIKRHAKELKTIRQDDALKAAQADAETARTALSEAQASLQQATSEREAALVERDHARRERDIERLLAKVNVPANWLEDLRGKLMEADATAYPAIIESEQSKAKAAGYRIPVTNAGQQVSAPIMEHKPSASPQPLDMSKFSTPEEFAAYKQGMRINE